MRAANAKVFLAAAVLFEVGSVAVEALSSHGLSSSSLQAEFEAVMRHQQRLKAPDLGDVSNIEKSLVSMAEAGLTTNVQPFLGEMTSIGSQMEAAIIEQSRQAQGALNTSWEAFVKCNFTSGSGPADLRGLNKTHRDCSLTEHALHKRWKVCLDTNCSADCRAVEACDRLQRPRPESCGIPDVSVFPGGPLVWMRQLRERFKNLLKDYNKQQAECQRARDRCGMCTQGCHVMEANWRSQKANCTARQAELEVAACSQDIVSCSQYASCYNDAKAHWLRTNASVAAQENVFLEQYASSSRVNCMADGFNNTINHGWSAMAVIANCRAVSFQQRLDSIKVKYFEQRQNPLRNCLEAGGYDDATLKLMPGTMAWKKEYYSNMPENTTAERCDACCCADLAGGPTCSAPLHMRR
eukprot:TRINITY_DN1814_c2_g6_i1.p1 TRINITY_DN1814_c2_g6~~TRINITY_DN1814_c2_g6_i1.p1  ORF type:complete len:410 (+),score=69.20 TRINITY_DN1814_c2_g6_i1:99-1328(+)